MEMKVAGELIQMNAHMVDTAKESTMFGIGAFLAVLGMVMLIVLLTDKNWKKHWKAVALFAVMTLVGFGTVYASGRMPKVQEIHACANGPISLEQVAAVYDIVKVDGKELILRTK